MPLRFLLMAEDGFMVTMLWSNEAVFVGGASNCVVCLPHRNAPGFLFLMLTFSMKKHNCCILPGDGIRETPPPKTNRHHRQNIYYMSL